MDELIARLHQITTQNQTEITSDTELIMSGILDSLNIAELITFLQDKTGNEILIADLDLSTLATPQDIKSHFFEREHS